MTAAATMLPQVDSAAERLVGPASEAPQGPAWLAALREAARERFLARGIPTTKEEDWRYTDLRGLARAGFAPVVLDAPVALDADALDALGLESVAEIPLARAVVVDGRFRPELSRLADLGAGVRVLGLEDAIEADDATVRAHLGQLAPTTHPFADLNLASFTGGVLIHIGANARAARPIEVLYVTTARATPGAIYPRAVLVLERGAQASVVEVFAQSAPSAALTCPVLEGSLGADAHLDHVRLQREGGDAFHVGGAFLRQERGSQLRQLNLALGGRLARADLHAVLAGAGAHARLDGIAVATADQVVDNHTLIDHASAHCTSFEAYRAILGGRARGVFNGQVLVRQDAQKTDAKQENRALLLSPDARIDTKPQLEIYADDVKCTHGATVGQLDQDALFYLRARGVHARAAERMLTYAFAAELVEEHEGLTAALRGEVVRALEAALLQGGPADLEG